MQQKALSYMRLTAFSLKGKDANSETVLRQKDIESPHLKAYFAHAALPCESLPCARPFYARIFKAEETDTIVVLSQRRN